MLNFLFAIFFLGILFAVWRLFAYEGRKDFLFFVLAIHTLVCVSIFISNEWLARVRHLIPLLLIISLGLRYDKILKQRKILGILVVVLYVFLFLSACWSQYPLIFLKQKWKICLMATLFLLAGTTIDSAKDIRKMMISILPAAIFAGLFLLGSKSSVSIDDRLLVEDVNANWTAVNVGVTSTFLMVFILYVRSKVWVKLLLIPFVCYGVYMLVRTGSRTACISIFMCNIVLLWKYVTSIRRFLFLGIPIGLFIIVLGSVAWSRLNSNLQERLVNYRTFSGRERVWEQAIDYMSQQPWYGTGGFVQGTFMDQFADPFGQIRWGSTLNIYMDVYVELGVLGLVIGGFACMTLLLTCYRTLQYFPYPIKYCALSFCLYGLLQGVGEGMPLRTTFIPNMVFMLGIGMLSNMVPWRAFAYCDFPPTPYHNGSPYRR